MRLFVPVLLSGRGTPVGGSSGGSSGGISSVNVFIVVFIVVVGIVAHVDNIRNAFPDETYKCFRPASPVKDIM
jgi:hypothetical protein